MNLSIEWNEDFKFKDFKNAFAKLMKETKCNTFEIPRELFSELTSPYIYGKPFAHSGNFLTNLQKELNIVIKCNDELINKTISEIKTEI